MERYLPGHTYDSRTLVRVYISLVVLAASMVALSLVPAREAPVEWIDLHFLKGLAIFGIAVIMSGIVAGFLMGLKYERSHLNALIFLGNIPLLALFVAFTWADVHFRGMLDPSFERQLNWESPVLKANEAASPGSRAGEAGGSAAPGGAAASSGDTADAADLEPAGDAGNADSAGMMEDGE